MSDKRRFQRRHLMLHLRVFDAETCEYIGNLSNVSEGGMMLTGDEPLTLDKAYNLRMRLPMEIRGQAVVDFSARVAWTSHDKHSAFYDSGLEFVDIDEDKHALLHDLIEEYALSDDD